MNKATEIGFGQSVRIARHYRRSVRIDADIGRLEALDGYVLTDTAREALSVMGRQIDGSRERAFTWTGPYGGGKSSLAVVLASALAAASELRTRAEAILGDMLLEFRKAFPVSSKGWLILPVIGTRGSISAEVAKALDAALQPAKPHKAQHVVRDLIEVVESERFDGVLLLVDEMGKFLEAAAAGGEDIHFFQDLAERARHCKRPLVTVGLLHQAFRQYASRLGIEARDEWAKIQGRYGDISFVATGDEVVQLIGKAIECDIPHPHSVAPAQIVAAAIANRRPAVGESMAALLDNCWPLHPITASLLGPASRRQFGQNERSVFGFLTSLEPYGFQDFLRTWDGQSTYGPDTFWNYLRTNLEQAILASPDGHRWAQAVEAVERAEAKGAAAVEMALTKALALIDFFRSTSGLLATDEVLRSAVADNDDLRVTAALNKLTKWRVALYRKHIPSWTVFEGSDFEIDQAVAKARASFLSVDTATLTSMANLHPVVAKRHLHETGTFRWMGISLHTVQEAERLSDHYHLTRGEFGRFALVLPDRQADADDVFEHLSTLQPRRDVPVVYGVPPNHQLVADLGAELVSLRIVEETSPELEGDAVARREVAARSLAIKGALEEALREAVANARWLIDGQARRIDSLSATASRAADDLFDKAPTVWSELINRDSLSSNSVKARRDLMHGMVERADRPALGIEGFPAERGLYETVLTATGLHYPSDDGSWRFGAPPAAHVAKLSPLWDVTEQAVREAGSKGVTAADLYLTWQRPPYGVKQGLLPVFLLAFAMSHAEHVAIYRDGMFEPKLTDVDADELLQDPRRFTLRWVDQDSVHLAAVESLAAVLARCGFAPHGRSPLNVARSLVKLAFTLSAWAKRTQRLSTPAKKVRDILLRASDPHRLLMIDLPSTLGVPITEVAATLEPLLQELLQAYPQMLERVDQEMAEKIDAAPGNDPELRDRAEAISGLTGNLRLQGFAARLKQRDGSLPAIEGILSLAANKPPRDWTDLDIDGALLAVSELALAFRKAEALVSVSGRQPGREAFAVVIGAGGGSTVVTKSFELAARDKQAVQGAADEVLRQLERLGLHGDLLFAALATAGAKLYKKENQHG